MTRVPFSYIIESIDGDLYVGSRYGVTCHPSQLLVSYFTSSRYVKPLILKDPSKWNIVRLVACASTQDAVNLECEWQMEFMHSNRLMNRRLNNGKFISHGPKSDKTRRKISESRLAMKIVPSSETREKLRLSSTGRTLSDASREKLSRSKKRAVSKY